MNFHALAELSLISLNDNAALDEHAGGLSKRNNKRCIYTAMQHVTRGVQYQRKPREAAVKYYPYSTFITTRIRVARYCQGKLSVDLHAR